MPRFVTRDAELRVGELEILARAPSPPSKFAGPPSPGTTEAQPTIRFVFDIAGDISREANKAKISIYNLSETSRAKLQSSKDEPLNVSLSAGYVNFIGRIFKGKVEYTEIEQQNADIVSSITCTDGRIGPMTNRIQVPYAAGTPYKTIALDIAKQMGVDLGSSAQSIANIIETEGRKIMSRGGAFTGIAADVLDTVLRTVGASWSIQGEELQVLESATAALDRGIPTITNSSNSEARGDIGGMIGAPHINEDGIVVVRSLLRPDLVPGAVVNIDSKFITFKSPRNNKKTTTGARYRIESVRHFGDTWGDGPSWFTTIEAKPL